MRKLSASFIAMMMMIALSHASPRESDAAEEWAILSPMPTQRTEVTAATVGSNIYLIGGFDGGGNTVDAVEVYDPRSNTWSTAKELPLPLHHAAAASYQGILYVVGGYLEGWIPSNRLFIYDQAINEWSEDRAMPTPRGALTAQFIDGILYAVGGYNGLPLRTNEAYDPSTGTWEVKAPMPTAREHLASGVADGKLHVIGGRQGGLSSNLNANEEYDPGTDHWAAKAPMPSKRGGIVGASVSGSIYVLGGESPTGTFGNNEQYVAEFDVWLVREMMPTARHGLAAAEAGGSIYVIGGGLKPGLSVSGKNESFTPGDWRKSIDVNVRAAITIEPDEEKIKPGDEIIVRVSIETNTAGYTVRFGELFTKGDAFIADITVIPPPPEMMVAQVITEHRHAYSLEGLGEGEYGFEVLLNGRTSPLVSAEFAVGLSPVIVETSSTGVVELGRGQELILRRSLENKAETVQPYINILQVKDSGGVTVSLSWIEGELLPNELARISQAWTPQSSGRYALELFVWEGMENPEVLAPMHTLTVRVGE